MKYLVDANVLSEATRPRPAPQVVRWLQEHEAALVVNPIILGELRFGILLLARGRRRERLERWFAAGAGQLHCVPWDAKTGVRWAELLAALRKSGRTMPIKDSLIAATALVHGFAVATRNRSDFQNAHVEVVDPFVLA